MNYKKILIFILLLLPVIVLAEAKQYQPLVGVPGVDGSGPPDLDTYINALYALSITIAALLAVIKIIIAGVKWMLSDVVTSKQEAKGDIWGATLGLLIIIAAVLILTEINPQITETSLLIPKTNEKITNLNSKTTMPRPTAPPGSTFTLMENNPTEKTICENQYIGVWHTDGTSDLVWCIKELKQIVKQETVGCLNNNGVYDCSNANDDCKNMGAIAPYSKPILTKADQEKPYERACIYE